MDFCTKPIQTYPGALILAQSAVPVIHLPTGSFTTVDGAMTVGTALPYVPSGTVTVYCTNSNLSVAGLYSATFSDATHCQIYNYGTVVKPTTTIAAYTAATSIATLVTVPIPSGILGLNGSIRVSALFSATNNANVKTFTAKYGTTSFRTTPLTSFLSMRDQVKIHNRGDAAKQVCYAIAAPSAWGGVTTANVYGTENSATALDLTLCVTKATATDNIILEDYTVEILRSPLG